MQEQKKKGETKSTPSLAPVAIGPLTAPPAKKADVVADAAVEAAEAVEQLRKQRRAKPICSCGDPRCDTGPRDPFAFWMDAETRERLPNNAR